MAKRKPNNLPWVLLGLLCGLIILGLFGFGVYSGAKSVSDQVNDKAVEESTLRTE